MTHMFCWLVCLIAWCARIQGHYSSLHGNWDRLLLCNVILQPFPVFCFWTVSLQGIYRIQKGEHYNLFSSLWGRRYDQGKNWRDDNQPFGYCLVVCIPFSQMEIIPCALQMKWILRFPQVMVKDIWLETSREFEVHLIVTAVTQQKRREVAECWQMIAKKEQMGVLEGNTIVWSRG